MNQYENDTITTLVVKHLPEFITSSNELQNNYFKPYKPIGVRFMQSQAMIGFVFLDFPDRDTAEKAYEQLKKINFGLYYKQVTVEYAKPDPNRQQASEPVTLTIEQHEQAADPISSSQGILYPPNPHLRYFYPDPTPDILANISNAIGTVPRFYTQVLHLMNKYNMPPPFGPIDKESIPSILKRKYDDLLASDESELEDDDNDNNNTTKTQEEKVKQARLGRIAAEKQKLAIATTTNSTTTAATAASVVSNTSGISKNAQNTKKIKINIGGLTDEKLKSTAPSTTNNDNPTAPTAAILALVSNDPPSNSLPPVDVEKLTEEQKLIRDKCLSMTELKISPAFKNYSSGTPSNKLYVKNLSKQVTQQDLFDLYSKFSQDTQVNLMTKGRLRDQAFITFPDEPSAMLALQCTNGYVLFDRPMAVLFGKSVL